MAKRKLIFGVPSERGYDPAESAERGGEGAFPLFEPAAAPAQERPGQTRSGRAARAARAARSVAQRASVVGGAVGSLAATEGGGGFLTSPSPPRDSSRPVGVPVPPSAGASPPAFQPPQQLQLPPSAALGVRGPPITLLLKNTKK